ncbi:hypothetical protein QOZ80_6AG0542050 [Eleusine coracana subsp. coracana]|nr:hypothetical protein QOZ80_6AG0542050 [Eleusine coracana subsp. coracana]
MSIDLTPPSPPRRGRRSPPPPDDWQSYPYPWPLPPPTDDEPSTSPGKVIVGVVVGVGATLIVLSILCSICQKMRPGNGAASRPAAARAAAAVAAPPRAPSVVALSDSDDDEECSWPRGGSSTAGLPSFTYSPSLKQNLTGSEEEAAACAVCLGEFGVGETVRLLPACLHLYHVDCIDPWLHAHSTCPICRSGTDPDRLPPV